MGTTLTGKRVQNTYDALLKVSDKKMDDYNKADSIPKSYMPTPRGIKDAQTAPVNMPNQGHYPGVK